MSGPDPIALAAIARWDGDGVRSGVAALASVADGLPAWRSRIEDVGRRLEDGSTWSGQAAAAAARSVLVLSHVTTALTAGLAESAATCRKLVPEVGAAAALARAALVAGPDDPGGAALAEEAAAHAERAHATLRAAGAALAGLGVADAFAPADFGALADRVPSAGVVPLPSSADPLEVVAWWAGLSALTRRALVQQRAPEIGALDGLPAWIRDRANRLQLARVLRARPAPTVRAVAVEIAAREAAGQQVQLHLFDPAGERVALVVGDADTADELAVLVPGVNTTPDDDLDAVTADVARAAHAAEAAGATAVAGVAWLGYRPPEGAGILSRARAECAGPVLDAALDGFDAARDAAGRGPSRTTVLAHSYGSVVLDEAADAPGPLAADAVVLLGSPGMELAGASLDGAEVYDAASLADPISWSGWFGISPWGEAYGAVELPVAEGTGHSDYLDPGSPTLAAVGAVVADGPSGR